MTDPMMKDIMSLIEAIDAIDGTPVGRLDEALNRIGDRASRIRRRREDELAGTTAHTSAEARSMSGLDCKFCRTTPNAGDPTCCRTMAEADVCSWFTDSDRKMLPKVSLAEALKRPLTTPYLDHPALLARVAELEAALRFYADPFAWKKLHDPKNDVQVPDFYSETSFGDTAQAALPTTERGA